jgi:hypothetical protein
MFKFALRAAALAVLALSSAHASVIETSLVGNDGKLVRTGNNQEWLDVNKTTNMSVNQALALYAPLGFRLANMTEVQNFFIEAGVTTIYGSPSSNPVDPGTEGTVANRAAVVNLFALWEHTAPYSDTAGNEWVHGYTYYGSSTNLVLSRVAAFEWDNLGRVNLGSNGTSWNYNTQHSMIGTFLVRDVAVPEPASILLMGVGAFGLLAARRRKA